jgi:Flp pilus assembly protein TadB
MLNIEEAIENLTGYVEARIELIKLDVKDQSVRVGVATLVWSLVGFFALMALVFLSIALAIVLGYWLGMAWGFVLVAVLYLAVGFALLLSKRWLQKQVELRAFSPDKADE